MLELFLNTNQVNLLRLYESDSRVKKADLEVILWEKDVISQLALSLLVTQT